MLYCFACLKRLEDSGMDHMFSGYGFCVRYCAEHCPGEVDGAECSDIECYEKKTGKKYIDSYSQDFINKLKKIEEQDNEEA